VTLDDIAGLAGARPGVAFGLTVCMLSLLGFPGTFGFIGKWYIITAVVAEGHYILPVILVLTSVVSAGYYLPVIMAMYMRPAPAGDRYAGVRLAPAALGAIALTIVAVLILGVWPGAALDLAGRSAATLTQTGVPIAGP
jgi:NADH-quinone oxidoreductase subunit N